MLDQRTSFKVDWKKLKRTWSRLSLDVPLVGLRFLTPTASSKPPPNRLLRPFKVAADFPNLPHQRSDRSTSQATAFIAAFIAAFSVPGPAAAAAPGRCKGLPSPRAAAAAAAARRHAGDERVHELAVEGHVDEGVDAAVEGEQPEQPAEGGH